MDLSTLAPVVRDVPILNPATNEPTGLVLRLRALSSPEVKAAQARITNEGLIRRRVKLTSDAIDENTLRIVIAAVEGWEWGGDANFHGEKLAFNEANLRAVLKLDWVYKQINAELGDEASFFPS